MFIRILTFVFLIAVCARAAQAGVMSNLDWDSGSSMAAADSSPPEEAPVAMEQNSPSSSTMADASSSHSPTYTAVYSAIDFFAFVPNFLGYVQLVDRALPPCPVLDGLLKPA